MHHHASWILHDKKCIMHHASCIYIGFWYLSLVGCLQLIDLSKDIEFIANFIKLLCIMHHAPCNMHHGCCIIQHASCIMLFGWFMVIKPCGVSKDLRFFQENQIWCSFLWYCLLITLSQIFFFQNNYQSAFMSMYNNCIDKIVLVIGQ